MSAKQAHAGQGGGDSVAELAARINAGLFSDAADHLRDPMICFVLPDAELGPSADLFRHSYDGPLALAFIALHEGAPPDYFPDVKDRNVAFVGSNGAAQMLSSLAVSHGAVKVDHY